MKKIILSFYLLVSAVILSACGSNEFNMTFDEAVQTSKNNQFFNFLADSDKVEQNFDFSTKVEDEDWNNLNLTIKSDSKQNLSEAIAQSNISIDANFWNKEVNSIINWDIDIRIIPETLYIKLNSLTLTWAGTQDLAMVSAMIEWFKNQRFSLPAEWIKEATEALKSYLEELNNSNDIYDWLYIQDGDLVKYDGKYSAYKWYNAWKFKLDDEKFDQLLKEYNSWIEDVLSESMVNNAENDENINSEEIQEISTVVSDLNSSNIESFEWYFVITNNNEIAVIIENMNVLYNNATINATFASWKEWIELNISSNEQNIINLSAEKKWDKYDIAFEIPNSMSIKWTISPKISKTEIKFNFDLVLNLIAWENELWTFGNDMNIPLKWSWNYKKVNSISIETPSDAQDLSQLLWNFLGGSIWGWDYEDYNYDEDYSDYEYLDNPNGDGFENNYDDVDWNDYLVEAE